MSELNPRDTGSKPKKTNSGRKRRFRVGASTKPKLSPKGKKPTESYQYGGGRKNLPTDQTGRNMKPKYSKPVTYKMPARAPNKFPKDLLPPRLAWERGMPDHTPASPLYIHEKLHPAAFALSLRKDQDQSMDLFFRAYDGLPDGAEFEWYKHNGRWQNRIIRGESRHVMASLLAKEGMTGKVQMVYFDPPYGIDFRKILQANLNKNKDAGEIPNDPVALQTFRDTYKNGIHSYLDNVYQIASHARELLCETGSFFLQIGSANVNRIGVLLDEVFGAENRMGIIPFAKTKTSSSKGLPDVTDYLLWYAKDVGCVKYHQLYEKFESKKDLLVTMSFAALLESKDKKVENLTSEQKVDPDKNIPNDSKLFKQTDLTSQRYSKTRSKNYEWNGKIWKCPPDRQWSVSYEGLNKLADRGRLYGSNENLFWKKYEDEFPGRKINNMWIKQESARDKHYVVETAETTIEKCILMTTDPGDLVFDPTCGSGTTAYVAEKWGRRWITSDAGLVAINLARQRIITGVFPWHMLLDSEKGHKRENELRKELHQSTLPEIYIYNEDPAVGFVYERMPHISPKYLAYSDCKVSIDYMVDRPERDDKRIRVSSPFTVESLSPYRYVNPKGTTGKRVSTARHNVVEALHATGIHMGGVNVRLVDLEEYPGKAITHTATFNGRRACVMVADDDCTVPTAMVDYASEEAAAMPNVEALIMVAFNYEPTVRNETRGRLSIYKAMANQDLQMGNLKDGKDSIAFVLVGEPDVKTKVCDGMMTAEIIGYDTFNPASGTTRPGTKNDVYCWMIDTEYDGRSFFARRIHFPGASKDKQIKDFHDEFKKRIDPSLWSSFLSLKSAPFSVPKSGRIAVKIITSTHTEMIAEININDTAHSFHKR